MTFQHADGDWLGLRKYDDSEARDDHGQWTSDGSSGTKTGSPTCATCGNTRLWHLQTAIADHNFKPIKAPKGEDPKAKTLGRDLRSVVQFGRLDGAGATALLEAGLATRGNAIMPLVLTDAGKAKLATLSKAEQTIVLTAIAKYSDDQPRDDKGQWTAGGGDSATGHAHSIINWNTAQAHIGPDHQHDHPGGDQRHNHPEQGIGGMGHTNPDGSFSYGPKYVPKAGPKGQYLPQPDVYTIGNHMSRQHGTRVEWGTGGVAHDALHAGGTVTDHYHPVPKNPQFPTATRGMGTGVSNGKLLYTKATGDWLHKYSDDEARDDNGKWTSTGGGGVQGIGAGNIAAPGFQQERSHATRHATLDGRKVDGVNVGTNDQIARHVASYDWRNVAGDSRGRLKAQLVAHMDDNHRIGLDGHDSYDGENHNSLMDQHDNLHYRAPIQKYSDDEARDDGGKWTSGGSMSVGGHGSIGTAISVGQHLSAYGNRNNDVRRAGPALTEHIRQAHGGTPANDLRGLADGHGQSIRGSAQAAQQHYENAVAHAKAHGMTQAEALAAFAIPG